MEVWKNVFWGSGSYNEGRLNSSMFLYGNSLKINNARVGWCENKNNNNNGERINE